MFQCVNAKQDKNSPDSSCKCMFKPDYCQDNCGNFLGLIILNEIRCCEGWDCIVQSPILIFKTKETERSDPV